VPHHVQRSIMSLPPLAESSFRVTFKYLCAPLQFDCELSRSGVRKSLVFSGLGTRVWLVLGEGCSETGQDKEEGTGASETQRKP